MLRNLPLSLIVEMTSGQLINGAVDIECSSVSTDTRTLKENSLYIPLIGENFDGHQFHQQAKAAGAVAMLSECDVQTDLPVIRVENTLQALGKISAWHRDQFTGPIVAVTGSAGKTSVKELTANVLSQVYNTWMTQGNLNNHIGAPLTLLALEPEHQAAMIELGASGDHEIAYTAAFVRPKVGIITNVMPVHIEGFGSVENIAKVKGELLDYITTDGTAVLNADDAFIDVWLKRAAHLNIKTFGLSPGADIRAENIVSDIKGCQFDLIAEGNCQTVRLPLLGEHNVLNALAVVAATRALDMNWDAIIHGLETIQPVGGRLQRCVGAQGQLILNDTYNANPTAFMAAIDVLTLCDRSWVVMGDMGELADMSDKGHRDVGLYAKSKNVKHFIATGTLSRIAVEAFGHGGQWFATRDEMAEYLEKQTCSEDTLLVKGSRSAGMDYIVSKLCHIEEDD